MWITRLIYKQKPLFKGHEWTQSRQLRHFGMIKKCIDYQCLLLKDLPIKWENDRRNFHIVRYVKVILAYKWFNLNFRLTKTAYWWLIQYSLHICISY